MSSKPIASAIDVAASYKDNRKDNCHNSYQGDFKRVLCVCSAGLLRSPTAAWVLAQPPYNYNTRACGAVPQYALVPLDPVLIEWADEIVCMSEDQVGTVKEMYKQYLNDPRHYRTLERRLFCLDIPDRFAYRNLALIEMIKMNYDKKVLGK